LQSRLAKQAFQDNLEEKIQAGDIVLVAIPPSKAGISREVS